MNSPAAIDLSNRESYPGFDVYRRVILEDTAVTYGEMLMRLYEDPEDKCFFEPVFRTESGLVLRQPGRDVGWLNIDTKEGDHEVNRLVMEATTDQQPLVDKFMDLSDLVDRKTDTKSSERKLQKYDLGTALMRHTDPGLRSRHITLSGTGKYSTFDSRVEGRRLAEIDLGPGDMVWTDDHTPHSVKQTGDKPRLTLGLIDYAA